MNVIFSVAIGVISLLIRSHDSRRTIESCLRLNRVSEHHSQVSDELLLLHCLSILNALADYPWARAYQDVVIANDILPFTIIREPPIRSASIYAALSNYVNAIIHNSSCDAVGCVVEAINGGVWNITEPSIVYGPSPKNGLNSYGVEQTLVQTNASCTGLAVFLATALRMAAVPARIAGVPHWKLGRRGCPEGDESDACGNHNWVEAYDPSSGWSFVDPRRIDRQVLPLNSSWFFPFPVLRNTVPRSGNHSVYAASYLNPNYLVVEQYPFGEHVLIANHYPMVWDHADRSVFAWDVSAVYLERKEDMYKST